MKQERPSRVRWSAWLADMNLQIETIKVASGGSVDAIRDIATVRKIIAIAAKAMHSIRNFPCGHKPNGVSGKCDACEALKEWDALSANEKLTP